MPAEAADALLAPAGGGCDGEVAEVEQGDGDGHRKRHRRAAGERLQDSTADLGPVPAPALRRRHDRGQRQGRIAREGHRDRTDVTATLADAIEKATSPPTGSRSGCPPRRWRWPAAQLPVALVAIGPTETDAGGACTVPSTVLVANTDAVTP